MSHVEFQGEGHIGIRRKYCSTWRQSCLYLQDIMELHKDEVGTMGGQQREHQQLKIVVRMKVRRCAKAAHEMFILFRMFNSQVSG